MDFQPQHPQPAVQAQHNTGFSSDFSTNVNDQLRNWKDPEACQQAPPPFDSIQEPSHMKAKTFTAQQKRKMLFWSLIGIAIAAFFAFALFAFIEWSKCHGRTTSLATSPQNEVEGADVVINIETGDNTKVSSSSIALELTSTATATVTLTEDLASSKAGETTVSVTLTAPPSLPTMPSRKETIATTSTSSGYDVEESDASRAMAERLSSIESKNSAEGATAKTVPLITDTITQRDPSVTILSHSPLCWMTDEHGAAYTGIEC
ncbi:hypothetical protein KC367_g2394 [Hortaea werneckii]|nr:hypothetical protein KC357_g3102 [Hortaea werneckii]KAI7502140.1 hypothetical protein KC367_g2394 [Hortaea werneckii]